MACQILSHTSIAFPCLWQKTATLNCKYAGQWACGFRQVQCQPKFWCVIGKREIVDDGEFFVRCKSAAGAAGTVAVARTVEIRAAWSLSLLAIDEAGWQVSL
jgi:hypothetical protein